MWVEVRVWLESAQKIDGVRNVLKVSELNHCVNERAYEESLHGKY